MISHIANILFSVGGAPKRCWA